ncbi:unnamed protein product [Rotaria sordida]|uniref:Uncharacterized protein n=1 Tax=Rotaria sordida TaxID=392033 RepID=A0A813SAT9_9BILA|nr:unnamed protein product [Rotaria sordida]
MSSSNQRLFQLAHANRHPENRFDYIIKHYFLRAPTLRQAHVYVTLYGYRISSEFYEDGDEVDNVVHPSYVIEHEQNRKVEEYEQMNEECSYGEHYWHSIKEIDTNKYDGGIIEVSAGSQLFKLSIQFKYPCIHLQQQEQLRTENDPYSYPYKYNMYQYEQNKYIYQLRATNKDDVLQYLWQHLEQFNLTLEILLNQFNRSSLDDIKTWDELTLLCEQTVKCIIDNESEIQHEKIIFSLDTITEQIITHNCEM